MSPTPAPALSAKSTHGLVIANRTWRRTAVEHNQPRDLLFDLDAQVRVAQAVHNQQPS
jgi:predicted 2-oxoglutarate/Fe(II)-dependent dioxygenase YbiX